jgi:RNA polymerase sigma-70 factor (ECF subfamily)
MHYLDGLNIDQLGAVFRVHRSTIARWIVTSRKEAMAALCRALALPTPTRSTEIRSLARALSSDVKLTLGRFLAAGTGER